MIIESLSLEGHDSELFSFLDLEYIEVLRNHSLSDMVLWSFGSMNSTNQLTSVPMWNTDMMCFAWTRCPNVNRDAKSGFANYRGYVTKDPLLEVRALVLLRHLFCNSYNCVLDDQFWIKDRADPTLERLRYIRSWGDSSINSQEWTVLKKTYFEWMIRSLNKIFLVAYDRPEEYV
jgi:hypothetical protein